MPAAALPAPEPRHPARPRVPGHGPQAPRAQGGSAPVPRSAGGPGTHKMQWRRPNESEWRGGPGRGARTQPGASAESRGECTWGPGGLQDRTFQKSGNRGSFGLLPNLPSTELYHHHPSSLQMPSTEEREALWATLPTLAGARNLVEGHSLPWGLTPGPDLALLGSLRSSTDLSWPSMHGPPFLLNSASSRQAATRPPPAPTPRTEIVARALHSGLATVPLGYSVF